METKAVQYAKVLQTILEEFAAHKPVNLSEVDNQIIIDPVRGHFQLLRVGWQEDTFVRTTVFHFDLKPDGKIWIQANWTDTDIAAKLVEYGVEKMDIVIGFQPRRYRPYSGYAVA